MNEQHILVHISRPLFEKKLFSFPSSRLWYLFAECCSHFKRNIQTDRPIKCKSTVRGLSPNYAMYSFKIKYLYLHLKSIFSLHFDHFAE